MATAVEQVTSAKRSRVLLADSEEVNLVHMTQLLQKSGYDVVTASDGPEVLRLLQFRGGAATGGAGVEPTRHGRD